MTSTDQAVLDSRPAKGFLRECWREAVALHPRAASHWGAAQVAISVALPLAALLGVHRADLTAYAVFGSLNSVYGKNLRRTDRLLDQLRAGAVMVAVVLIGTTAGIVGPAGAITGMSAVSVAGPVLSRRYGWLPNPALFMVFAVATIAAEPRRAADLPVAVAVSTAAAFVAVLVGQAIAVTVVVQSDPLLATKPPPRPLRSVLSSRDVLVQLFTHVVAPCIAGLLATLAGFGHPFWAAVSATVPLSGPTPATQVARGVLRALGTGAGVVLAYAAIAPSWPVWGLVLAIGVLQFLTESFVARNYGIAVLFITPMALALSHLGGAAPAQALIADRLVETGLGVSVAGLVLLVSRFAARRGNIFPKTYL